jgi:hypothetical protein
MKCYYCNNAFVICNTTEEYVTKLNKIHSEIVLVQKHFNNLLNKNGDIAYYSHNNSNNDINRRTFDKLCNNYIISKQSLLLFGNNKNLRCCPAHNCSIKICNNCYYKTNSNRQCYLCKHTTVEYAEFLKTKKLLKEIAKDLEEYRLLKKQINTQKMLDELNEKNKNNNNTDNNENIGTVIKTRSFSIKILICYFIRF